MNFRALFVSSISNKIRQILDSEISNILKNIKFRHNFKQFFSSKIPKKYHIRAHVKFDMLVRFLVHIVIFVMNTCLVNLIFVSFFLN